MNRLGEPEEEHRHPLNKRRIFAISALLLVIATTYASNNVITNNRIEFGQGIYNVSACDYSIAISGTAGSGDQIFGTGSAISAGDGTWQSSDYMKEVEISQFIPAKCSGKTLTIKFYGSSENSPLPIFLHKFGYDFATCVDPNNYLAGAPGSNACDGKPANAYNGGSETRWLSAWGNTSHQLKITFDSEAAISYIGVWNGDDDQDQANLRNRKFASIDLCPSNINWMCSSGSIQRDTNYSYFASMTNPTSIGGQYPGRFGSYFPDTTSRYWRLTGYDYGGYLGAASDAYYCPAYTSGGTNGQCSQVGEIQFFSSSNTITLQVSNSGAITVQNGIGTNVSFISDCSSLTQNTLTGGYGNFPTKAQALLVPEIGVCQNASGSYKIRFAYPALKIADVTKVVVETSPTVP